MRLILCMALTPHVISLWILVLYYKCVSNGRRLLILLAFEDKAQGTFYNSKFPSTLRSRVVQNTVLYLDDLEDTGVTCTGKEISQRLCEGLRGKPLSWWYKIAWSDCSPGYRYGHQSFWTTNKPFITRSIYSHYDLSAQVNFWDWYKYWFINDDNVIIPLSKYTHVEEYNSNDMQISRWK